MNNSELIRKAMSLLGSRMTPKKRAACIANAQRLNTGRAALSPEQRRAKKAERMRLYRASRKFEQQNDEGYNGGKFES